jgi:hypothetical protein
MNIGESVNVVVITTASVAGYPNAVAIDGANRSVNWVGGTAPSDGGTGGVDIYGYTIIKTASNSFTIIGSQTKTTA